MTPIITKGSLCVSKPAGEIRPSLRGAGKLDLDPRRWDQYHLAILDSCDGVSCAFVLAQRLAHGAPRGSHQRAGIEMEIRVAAAGGLFPRGCLFHVACGAGPMVRFSILEAGHQHSSTRSGLACRLLNCPASARNPQLDGRC